jgi:hypothetical protein
LPASWVMVMFAGGAAVSVMQQIISAFHAIVLVQNG